MPTGGDWTPLKHDATNFVKDNEHSSVPPGDLLRKYVKANGGARAIARRGSGVGSAGARGSGRSSRPGSGGRSSSVARSVGRNLGGFLSSVGRIGLAGTLRDIGLAHLIGRPVEEVTAGLLDALAAPGSTLDEHAARFALAKLQDELFENTETYEDVERALSQVLDQQGLMRLLTRFFGYYLYERFCRDFYETWIKKVGSVQAARSLKSIKDCIESSVKAKLIDRDVTHVNWRSSEGLRLTEQVMQETLEIFEVLI